jgi:ribosomal protein S1
VGCIVKGSVRNVTDFGIFVGLDEGIDGLVHVSDISWKQRQFKPADVATKGDEIEVKVLNIDVEQERLSLGIKQLTDDPWKNLDENNPLGTDITGTVVNLTDFGIFVEVSDGVEGLVHISEIDDSIQKNKIHEVYPVGTEVKTKVMKIDLEERRLGLSITEILSTPPPVVEVPEEDSKAKTDSAEEEKESVSAEDAPPETDKEEEKESVTTDEIEDKVDAEAETAAVEEKKDAVEAEVAPSVEKTDVAAEKETPPAEEKEVEIVKETVSLKIKKKAPTKKETAPKKEKEDAVEAEAAPSVEKTDAAAKKETVPKKGKEDAVEESLESKAKNDEDSSEKETIEKPESPESN